MGEADGGGGADACVAVALADHSNLQGSRGAREYCNVVVGGIESAFSGRGQGNLGGRCGGGSHRSVVGAYYRACQTSAFKGYCGHPCLGEADLDEGADLLKAQKPFFAASGHRHEGLGINHAAGGHDLLCGHGDADC